MKGNNGQIALFEFSDEEQLETLTGINRFTAVEKRKDNKPDGELLGLAFTLGKKSDLRKKLGLEGKHNDARFEKAVLSLTDDMLTGIKMEVAGLDSQEFTAHNTPITKRRLKNGQTVTTIKIVTVDRDDRVDTAELAAQLGIPEEQVIAMREAKLKKDREEAAKTVEVPSEVVQLNDEEKAIAADDPHADEPAELTDEQEKALAEAIAAREQEWTEYNLTDGEKADERALMRMEAIEAAQAVTA
jgi:hypothetical protein